MSSVASGSTVWLRTKRLDREGRAREFRLVPSERVLNASWKSDRVR